MIICLLFFFYILNKLNLNIKIKHQYAATLSIFLFAGPRLVIADVCGPPTPSLCMLIISPLAIVLVVVVVVAVVAVPAVY